MLILIWTKLLALSVGEIRMVGELVQFHPSVPKIEKRLVFYATRDAPMDLIVKDMIVIKDVLLVSGTMVCIVIWRSTEG